MVEKVDTSVTVSFGDDGGRFQKSLILEAPYQVFYGSSNKYVVYLYPAVNADLKTSQGGSIAYAPSSGSRTRTVTNEYLKFSGNDRVKTRYPAGDASSGALTVVTMDTDGTVLSGGAGAGVQIEKVWAEFFDENGKTVIPTFSYDFETGEVVSSHECYGAVRVTYDTSYKVLHYEPLSSFDYRTGFSLTMDTIIAFYKGALAEYEFTANIVTETTQGDLNEVIQVYTEIVVDEEGAWEMPDDFPDNGTTVKYNNNTGYPGPNPNNYLTNRRIVVTVYGDVEKSRLYERRFTESLEQPFSPALQAGHWFQPEYKITTTIPSEATSDFVLEIQAKEAELKEKYGIE